MLGTAWKRSTRTVESAVRPGGLEQYYVGGHMNHTGNRFTAELVARHLAAP